MDDEGPAVRRIEVSGFEYRPASMSAGIGDTVVWVNRDAVPHTATGKTWDTGEVKTGESGRFVARRAGTYAYYCAYHPTMKGTIIVTP